MSFDCLLKKLHRNCLPFNVHTSSFSVKFLIYDSLILGLWSGFPIATIFIFPLYNDIFLFDIISSITGKTYPK